MGGSYTIAYFTHTVVHPSSTCSHHVTVLNIRVFRLFLLPRHKSSCVYRAQGSDRSTFFYAQPRHCHFSIYPTGLRWTQSLVEEYIQCTIDRSQGIFLNFGSGTFPLVHSESALLSLASPSCIEYSIASSAAPSQPRESTQ